MNKTKRKDLKLPLKAWGILRDGKLMEDFPRVLPKLYDVQQQARNDASYWWGSKVVKLEIRESR